MPPRDPLAVAYDGQTAAFLDLFITVAPTVSGIYHPYGFISNAGIVSAPVAIMVPPLTDPAPYLEAFHRSMRYQFRLRTYPLGPTGRPLRRKDERGNWAYVRGPWWCVVEIQGPSRRVAGAVAAVVRIGPQNTRLGTSPDFESPV